MTHSEAIAKLNFFTSTYVNVVSLATKENSVCGLAAGRAALELLNCPTNVIDAIEKSMIEKLK